MTLFEKLKHDFESGEFYKVYYSILNLQAKRELDLNSGNINDDQIDIVYLKLTSLFKLNLISEVLSEVNTYIYLPNLAPISKLKLLVIYIRALVELGNLRLAMEIILQADFELQSIDFNLSPEDEKIIGLYFHTKGTLFIYRGDFNQAIHYLKKALVIRENYQETQEISDTVNNMGMVYHSFGEFELATKCFLECISLDQSLNYEKGVSISLNNLGSIALQTGDLEEAYNYLFQSYNLVMKICNVKEVPEEINGIHYKTLDIIILTLEDYRFIGDLFSNLGNVLYKLGDISSSLLNYAKSLYVYQKLNNVALLSDLYLQLISINLDIGDLEQSNYYLRILNQISSSESKVIQLRKNFAQGLIDNSKRRYEGKYKAQMAFRKIINDEIIDWNISIKAMTFLSDMLFEEFMFFEDPDIIVESKSIVDKMHTIAKDKKSFSLLVETYILKMKFAVIDGNFNKALLYLDQAYFTSTEKNLSNLVKKVNSERERLEKDWNDLNSSSLVERFEKMELGDYMNKIKGAITLFKD